MATPPVQKSVPAPGVDSRVVIGKTPGGSKGALAGVPPGQAAGKTKAGAVPQAALQGALAVARRHLPAVVKAVVTHRQRNAPAATMAQAAVTRLRANVLVVMTAQAVAMRLRVGVPGVRMKKRARLGNSPPLVFARAGKRRPSTGPGKSLRRCCRV